MKKLFIFALMALLGTALAAQEEFRVTRLDEKAAVFQIGREDPMNVIALASRRGLVVIDTGVLPSRGTALRSAIEREFKRRDFAYVINTHAHFDHSNGNQAFADVPIIGHQNAVREMDRWLGSPDAVAAFLQSRAEYQAELETELKTVAAGSRDEIRIREQLAENAALVDDLRQGRLVLTKPTVLFSDRLTIDLSDLTLNLVYFGRAHIESDILIYVPELRLLAVGDLFFKVYFPSLRYARADVPRWFQSLDGLPAGLKAVERVISGHGEPMSGDELRAQVAYLRGIWEGVAAARRDGLTLAATKERIPFDDKSPYLSGLRRMGRTGQGPDRHLANIDGAWRLQSESAARTLEALIASHGLEAGVAEYRKTIAGNERYNVAEDELNALGYRCLQSGRTAEALAIFEINTETFPRSWNVWDSLAEAWMIFGDLDKAEKYYQKSVELNPENQNGKIALRHIRGSRLNAAPDLSETQEAEKQKIAQVVSSVIGWAKDKNLDLFFSSIANDEDYISVTPTKRIIKRFEDVKQNVPFWMSPDFKYVRHELKDLEIKFARCGEVAWFFCILDDINTYKGEPATWENTRWTGVVEKRDGKWVVVSQHFSFASDK